MLDYCQDPYDIIDAFKRGVEFSFCKPDCQKILEKTVEGKGLMRVAERQTAKPYAQPQPSIFISYARDDFEASEKLRDDLQRSGYQNVWKDVYEIVGGVEWEPAICSAMEKHDFVISCFTRAALAKPRFFQEEMRVALGLHGAGRLHMIPVRFDECDLPQEVRRYHIIDLFPDWEPGIESIRLAITRL